MSSSYSRIFDWWGCTQGGRGSQRRVRSRSILYTIFESSSLAQVSCFLMLLWVLKATVGLFGKSLESSGDFSMRCQCLTHFNAAKTQLICFQRTTCSVQCHFSFDGQSVLVVDSVVYLGNTLQFNLSDKLDIHSKSMSFIRKANTVVFRFKCTDPLT